MLALVGTVMLRLASQKVLIRDGDTVLGTHTCQRSSVRGDTSRTWRSGTGSSLLSALSRLRSSHDIVGRGLVRRSTVTSCRSVRISTSLAASERASSASQLSTRTSIR